MVEEIPARQPHYNAHPSGVECIELCQYFGFNLGSAFKYLWRWRDKDSMLMDLEKAQVYLGFELRRRKANIKTCEKEPPWDAFVLAYDRWDAAEPISRIKLVMADIVMCAFKPNFIGLEVCQFTLQTEIDQVRKAMLAK